MKLEEVSCLLCPQLLDELISQLRVLENFRQDAFERARLDALRRAPQYGLCQEINS